MIKPIAPSSQELAIPSNSVGYFDLSKENNVLQGQLLGKFNVHITVGPRMRLSGGRSIFNLGLSVCRAEDADISRLVTELPLKA